MVAARVGERGWREIRRIRGLEKPLLCVWCVCVCMFFLVAGVLCQSFAANQQYISRDTASAVYVIYFPEQPGWSLFFSVPNPAVYRTGAVTRAVPCFTFTMGRIAPLVRDMGTHPVEGSSSAMQRMPLRRMHRC